LCQVKAYLESLFAQPGIAISAAAFLDRLPVIQAPEPRRAVLGRSYRDAVAPQGSSYAVHCDS
jgi:hypothetical protein